MKEVNVKKARQKFRSLLDEVEHGEGIIITRRGKKIACVVPLERKASLLPSLEEFRASIHVTGTPLSETVITERKQQRN